MTNNEILRKKFVIARKRSARFGVSSALGALGRRFEFLIFVLTKLFLY